MNRKSLLVLSSLVAFLPLFAQQPQAIAPQGESLVEAEEPYGWETAPRYRGFVEYTQTFSSDEYRVGLVTSHGCQLNPYIYLGAGVGVEYWYDYESCVVPIFAHFRSEIHNLIRRNASPFLDFRIGYGAGDPQGLYLNPSVGCHFYLGHSKQGLSVRAGYVLQGTDYSWDAEDFYYGYWDDYEESDRIHAFLLSFGYDF